MANDNETKKPAAPETAPEQPQADTPPQPQGNTGHQQTAAASPGIGNDTTVVQKAVNVIESAAVQRQAISEAFEVQKASITEGVKIRREAAMQEMAAVKEQYASQRGNPTMTQPQNGAPGGAQYQYAPPPGQAVPQEQTIAQELADTIRAIIAEEIDKQLKNLLAIYTAQEAQSEQPQANPNPQGKAE